MTAKDFSKYVTERFAKGETAEKIAGSLGITVEALYRKMSEGEDKDDTK